MPDIEEKLLGWIEASLEDLDPAYYAWPVGEDRDQLSAAERAVFLLDPARMAFLMVVYDAYHEIAGIQYGGLNNDPLGEEARAALPWIAPGRSDADSFQRFAALFGISCREALAYYTRQLFRDIRDELWVFADETEEEALRAVRAAKAAIEAAPGRGSADV